MIIHKEQCAYARVERLKCASTRTNHTRKRLPKRICQAAETTIGTSFWTTKKSFFSRITLSSNNYRSIHRKKANDYVVWSTLSTKSTAWLSYHDICQVTENKERRSLSSISENRFPFITAVQHLCVCICLFFSFLLGVLLIIHSSFISVDRFKIFGRSKKLNADRIFSIRMTKRKIID